jgi:hypothetical protein
VSDNASQDKTKNSVQGEPSRGEFSNLSKSWELVKEHRWVWFFIGLGLLLVFTLVYLYALFISRQYGFELGQGGVHEAGSYGDIFGALTAFFTGAGFVGGGIAIFSQLQNLRRQEERMSDEEKLELYAITMRTVNEMESYFNTDRMRKLRCVASGFFLKALMNDELEKRELREEAADHLEKFPIGYVDEDVEEFAIRDVLNYLETVAHFTNHEAVNDDLVLGVFHTRLRVYSAYAKKYFAPLRRNWDQDNSLVWIELRKLYTGGTEKWLNKEYDKEFKGHEVPPEDRPKIYSDEELLASLKREHVRCHVRL